jgi:hypothetical protein
MKATLLTAAAGTTTVVDIDILAEMAGPNIVAYSCTIIPDAAMKPTFGDTINFQVLDSDGTTIDYELGSFGVDPNAQTLCPFEEGSEGMFIEMTTGQKVRVTYTSVALLVGCKVMINLEVPNTWYLLISRPG